METWRCKLSPTGAHRWTISEDGLGRCFYCKKMHFFRASPAYYRQWKSDWQKGGHNSLRQFIWRRRVSRAIVEILKGHGLPLHWEVIVDMVHDYFPYLKAADGSIYNTLINDKDIFRGYGEGIYGLSEW
jgi:hypothetical protein